MRFAKPQAGFRKFLRRRHKAQGGAEGRNPGLDLGGVIKPVKRAADSLAVAHFAGFGSITTAPPGLTPQASCFRLLRRLKSNPITGIQKRAIGAPLTRCVNKPRGPFASSLLLLHRFLFAGIGFLM